MCPSLRVALDKLLVKMVSDQWRDMRTREQMSGSVGKLGNDIDRVRGWSRELENGEKLFRRELQDARKQIEESAEIAARPSRDLEDYTALGSAIGANGRSTANRRSPNRQRTGGLEKQGWLNLRTVTGKPTRTVWLRRWFYVKNGIFGWLVQGSRSGGVEESERIGVLLCSVRLANLEDRHFCFEVKTKDTTTIVQAETQTELLGWIEAFEIAKQKALEDPSSLGSPGIAGQRAAEAAFAILPPSIPEFAASGTDSSMQQLVDDNLNATFDRSSNLPLPGGDSGFIIAYRHSFDVSTHRRSTPSDREGESGKDHASRIIQKLDLHRKSTSSPQVGGIPASPLPSSPTLSGGGIASLIAASHSSIPGGPGMFPQPPHTENPAARVLSPTTIRDLPMSTLAPNTLINPPAPTNLSSIAVMVNGERGVGNSRTDPSGSLPNGIMANIWGSSNWGYLNSLERGKSRISLGYQAQPHDSHSTTSRMVSDSAQGNTSHETVRTPRGSPTSSPPHRPNASLEDDDMVSPSLATLQQGYPSYYPLQLKTQDAQFQLLFPDVGPEEKPVLVFRATWNLNNHQEFPGRVYVTAKKMYFYCNHLGLVLISEMSLSLISEVTAAPGRECDFLFVQLKAKDANNGPTRITIKTFLEPLKLLQRRLNFLVQNCSTPQVLDLESILKSLIKIEQDDPASSPSLESWEEVSMNTPFEDGSLLSRRASQRNPRDLRARVLVDGRLYGGVGKTDESKENARFKLPGHPVAHVPSGMDRLAAEKIFDISPKALFHVMFGDRSAVWQLLYHERQAQRRKLISLSACLRFKSDLPLEIRQGSWTQLTHGHQRREFEYQIEHHDVFSTLCP